MRSTISTYRQTIIVMSAHTFLGSAIKIFIIIVCIVVLLYVVKKLTHIFQLRLVEYAGNHEDAKAITTLSGEAIFFVALFVACIAGLYLAGFNAILLVAGVTFGVGYIFKTLFTNLISGILMMTTKDLALGDLIEVYVGDTVYYGRLDMITIRYTVLRKLNMTRVIIPNHLMTRSAVVTLSSEENVRLETWVTIQKDTDIKKCFEVIKTAINGLDCITQKNSTLVNVDSFEKGNIVIHAYFYFNPAAGKLRIRVVSEVNEAITNALKNAGINFGYPHTVYTTDANDDGVKSSIQQYAHAVVHTS